MLAIRPEQYEALEQRQHENYVERLRSFFAETIPEALRFRSEDDCRQIVRGSIRSGMDLGITDDKVMARYVGLHFYLKGSVLEVPAAKKYLQTSDLEPNTRVRVLCDQLEIYLRGQGR